MRNYRVGVRYDRIGGKIDEENNLYFISLYDAYVR